MSQITKIPKPPIGVMPKYIWKFHLENPESPSKTERESRVKDLQSAIVRYQSSPYNYNPAWESEIIAHETILSLW